MSQSAEKLTKPNKESTIERAAGFLARANFIGALALEGVANFIPILRKPLRYAANFNLAEAAGFGVFRRAVRQKRHK